MNVTLLLSSLSFIAGGLLIAIHLLAPQRQPVADRLTTVRRSRVGSPNGDRPVRTAPLLLRLRSVYERDLRRTGGAKTLRLREEPVQNPTAETDGNLRENLPRGHRRSRGRISARHCRPVSAAVNGT